MLSNAIKCTRTRYISRYSQTSCITHAPTETGENNRSGQRNRKIKKNCCAAYSLSSQQQYNME